MLAEPAPGLRLPGSPQVFSAQATTTSEAAIGEEYVRLPAVTFCSTRVYEVAPVLR